MKETGSTLNHFSVRLVSILSGKERRGQSVTVIGRERRLPGAWQQQPLQGGNKVGQPVQSAVVHNGKNQENKTEEKEQ